MRYRCWVDSSTCRPWLIEPVARPRRLVAHRVLPGGEAAHVGLLDEVGQALGLAVDAERVDLGARSPRSTPRWPCRSDDRWAGRWRRLRRRMSSRSGRARSSAAWFTRGPVTPPPVIHTGLLRHRRVELREREDRRVVELAQAPATGAGPDPARRRPARRPSPCTSRAPAPARSRRSSRTPWVQQW